MKGRYDIVAAVTRAIALRLQDAVNQTDASIVQTVVTTRRPGGAEPVGQPQINLYLFQVAPNAYVRNLHEPWRVQGRQVEQPTTALDLFYLISFSGSEELDQLVPQRLLGIVTNALNVNATISEQDLLSSDGGGSSGGLAPAASLQITPHSLSVEEMSRLWAMFPQAPYQLSVCYRASAALLVADVVLQPSPPPRTVASAVSPATLPVIRQVSDPVPIDGDILTVTGERFAGASVIVQFDGAPLPTTPLGAATLSCTLSGPDLRAGSGDLRVLRDGVLSDAFPLALGPRLKAVSAKVKESSAGWSGEIEVSLSPPLQPGQSLELDLFSAGGNGGAYGFVYDAPWNGTVPLGKVQVPVAGLAAGRYAVLIKVDDAAGRLARNAAGAYGPPLLRIGKAAS